MFKLYDTNAGERFPMGDNVSILGISIDAKQEIHVRTYIQSFEDLSGGIILEDQFGINATGDHGDLSAMPQKMTLFTENPPEVLRECFVHGKHIDYLNDIINALWIRTLEINAKEKERLQRLLVRSVNVELKQQYWLKLNSVQDAIVRLQKGWTSYSYNEPL